NVGRAGLSPMVVEPDRVRVHPTRRLPSLSLAAPEKRCRRFLPVAQKILRPGGDRAALADDLPRGHIVLIVSCPAETSAAVAGVALAAFLNHPLPLPRHSDSLKIHEN